MADIKSGIKSIFSGLFMLAAIVAASVFVCATAWIEHEGLQQLLPEFPSVVWLLVIGISMSKILLPFLNVRKSEGWSEGVSFAAMILLVIFAILMVNVVINNHLYKPTAQEAFDTRMERRTGVIKQQIEGIDEQIQRLEGKLNNNGKIDWATSRELTKLRQERAKVLQSSTQSSEGEERLTKLDGRNKVFAAYVYMWQDIMAGNRYSLVILIVSIVFSIMIELLVITLSSKVGTILMDGVK